MRLVGTTKSTIQAIRERTHWNAANLTPLDPVTLGLCSQIDLDLEVPRLQGQAGRAEAERDAAAGRGNHRAQGRRGSGARRKQAAGGHQRRHRVRQAQADRRQERRQGRVVIGRASDCNRRMTDKRPFNCGFPALDLKRLSGYFPRLIHGGGAGGNSMKLLVVFASLIAAVSLHSGAFRADGFRTRGRETRGSHRRRRESPRPHPKPRIAAPEKARAEGQAPGCVARSRAGTLGHGPFQQFLPRRQQRPMPAPSQPGSAYAHVPFSQRERPGRLASHAAQGELVLFDVVECARLRALSHHAERGRAVQANSTRPGTILVRQREKRLYYVNGDGTAIRYAIAVGREGAAWSGTSTVSDKTRMAGLDADAGHSASASPICRAMWTAARPIRSAHARSISGQTHVSHPRHQRAVAHRRGSLVRLHPHDQRRRGRSL